jgi:hypothetical protein
MPDFEMDAAAPQYTEEQLSDLAALLGEVQDVEEEIGELERTLKERQKALWYLQTEILPEKMDEIGMKCFTLQDGRKVEVLDAVKASIPKAKRLAAHQWLRENGHGSLIKNVVKATFGKGEDKMAQKLRVDLEAAGYLTDQDESVHASTLKAFVREQLEQGAELPADLLGIFEYRTTKVS